MHRRPALRADLGQPREPRAREHPGRAGLRHRQHRHRRAALGLGDRRPVRQPASCRRCTTATRGSSSSPPTAARTGATACAGSPRASRASPSRTPRSTSSCRVHPNPRVREELAERSTGSTTCCSPSRSATPTFARLLARCDLVITDSGGIQEEAPVAGQAGAGRARDAPSAPRASRPGRCGWSAPTPTASSARPSACSTTRSRTPEMATAENPYGDGRAAERIVAALEHLLPGGDPPTPFGAGYTRPAIARGRLGYDAGCVRSRTSTVDDRAGASTVRTTAANDASRSACRSTGCRRSGSCSSTVGVRGDRVMLVWTTLLFFRGAHARTWPPDAPLDGADALHLGVPRARAQRGGHDPRQRRAAAGDTGGATPHRRDRRRLRRRHGRDSRRDRAPDLHVLRREPPDARMGKAAALNHAYRRLGETLGEPASIATRSSW